MKYFKLSFFVSLLRVFFRAFLKSKDLLFLLFFLFCFYCYDQGFNSALHLFSFPFFATMLQILLHNLNEIELDNLKDFKAYSKECFEILHNNQKKMAETHDANFRELERHLNERFDNDKSD